MAKQLCMVEKGDKGNETRKYFIACEKEAKQVKTIRVLPPQLLRWEKRSKTVPLGHFIPLQIITMELTFKLAKDGHDMFEHMRPESSLVLGYNKTLRAVGEVIDSFPTHTVETSYGLKVQERCYPMRLWENANNYFWNTWMPLKAPKYLKYRQPELLPIIPTAITDLQQKLTGFLLPAPQQLLFS